MTANFGMTRHMAVAGPPSTGKLCMRRFWSLIFFFFWWWHRGYDAFGNQTNPEQLGESLICRFRQENGDMYSGQWCEDKARAAQLCAREWSEQHVRSSALASVHVSTGIRPT